MNTNAIIEDVVKNYSARIEFEKTAKKTRSYLMKFQTNHGKQ